MSNSWKLLVFGPSDWWANNPSCCTHLVKQFSKNHKIIYINPFSSDITGTRSHKGLWTRVLRKTKSLLKFCRKPEKNIWVISPLFLPIQGIPFFDNLNNLLILTQIKAVMLLAAFKDPILWVENIRAADFVNKINKKIAIYHASDRFDECPYTKNKAKLIEREQNITNLCDLVICVSKELYEHKLRQSQCRVIYLDHGVDYNAFRNAKNSNQFHKNVDGPTVGYFGTLTAQNDIELLEYCANRLPDYNFVFAGQITAGDYSNLKQMKNVIFLGKVPYDQIPSLCSSFDICLLPWVMNKWILNCNPLKLKEYMASGKPIVSVPIREVVENYSEILSIAKNKEEFCNRIQWEISNDTMDRMNKRILVASKNDWAEHSQIIETEINLLLTLKS